MQQEGKAQRIPNPLFMIPNLDLFPFPLPPSPFPPRLTLFQHQSISSSRLLCSSAPLVPLHRRQRRLGSYKQANLAQSPDQYGPRLPDRCHSAVCEGSSAPCTPMPCLTMAR